MKNIRDKISYWPAGSGYLVDDLEWSKIVNKMLEEIRDELISAIVKFHPFNSGHEGYGVILEELEELWGEIKNSKETKGNEAMRKEAIQIAAMSLRFIVDLCEE